VPTVSLSAALLARGPLGVQVEAAYAPRGHAYPGGEPLHSDYVELPLLLRLSPTRPRSVLPVALAGVAPAFELSCGGATRPATVGGGPTAPQPRDCMRDRQTRYDFAFVSALGLDVPVRRGVLTAEVRYTHGAQDLLPSSQFAQAYNRALTVLFGVRSGGRRAVAPSRTGSGLGMIGRPDVARPSRVPRT
jgi:hypothetical protein